MDSNEKYQYNFEYSMANYHRAEEQQTENQSQSRSEDQEAILRRSNQLIEFACFRHLDTQRQIMTIFTHFIQYYGRVAVRLFRICQKTFQNMQVTSSIFIRNQQQIIQHERQKLVENLTQLCKIFYDEKEKYYKLISLCISGAIFKILTLQNQIVELEFQTVFHSVFWEITGMHSTSQMLKKLLTETFDPISFHNYLINQEPTKICKFNLMPQSLMDKNMSSIRTLKMMDSVKEPVPKIKIFGSQSQTRNQEEAVNDELAFSKKIKRKQKLSKQNAVDVMNIGNQRENNTNQSSNEKMFNFKKDRINYFQNFSKSKSNKKFMVDLNSNSKKPTFANYLQQKRLNF